MSSSIAERSTNPAIEPALIRALESDPRQVAAEHGFGGTIVFTLTPDDGRRRPDGIAADSVVRDSCARVASPDRLPLLFDGDRDTRWLTAESSDRPGVD